MKTKRHYNRNRRKRGGVQIATVFPGDANPTIYDDEIDPFSSPETSPSDDEIMRAKEIKRRWVKKTKKQRAAAKEAAKYNKMGTQMKTPKKSLSKFGKSISHKSMTAPSKKTPGLDTNALFAKLGVLSENPGAVAGKPQRRRTKRKRKRATKRKRGTKRKRATKRKRGTKRKRATKRKRGGAHFIDSDVLEDTIKILKESTDRTIETAYEEIILSKKDANYEEIVELSTTRPALALKIFTAQFLEKYGSLTSKVKAIVDSISVIDKSKTSYESIEQILENFNNKRNIILSTAFPYPEIKKHLIEPLEELRTKIEREQKIKQGRILFEKKKKERQLKSARTDSGIYSPPLPE